MKYCDDANCPQFGKDEWGECGLGFIIQFRVPKTLADAVYHKWGYVMPKVCRKRITKSGAMK